jgi:hypothetical protein
VQSKLINWYSIGVNEQPGEDSICFSPCTSRNNNASISWSEAGFFYFAASLLFLLFPGLPLGVKLPWIALAATIVAPYVIFSLYY